VTAPPPRLDPREATAFLAADPVFGPVVEAVGPVELDPVGPDETPFASLVRAIVYQQLAGAAARTIHGRLAEVVEGRVEPPALLAADPEELRGAGLSTSKLRAVLELARRVEEGEVPLDDLDGLDDDAVVEALTRVWGIGVWTARMFLIHPLRRPDVWPVGDLGVRKGWARIHGLEEVPGPDELQGAAHGYRPWRTAVAWYCWRALDALPPVS
jgi:3-methyladenine DNA glycosylase/8-oxoguanine DNA glycosylase